MSEPTYPLPTVHMGGTPKDTLLNGYHEIHSAINQLKEAIKKCEFHSRDYYVQDKDIYSMESYLKAHEERVKHTQAVEDFDQYVLTHYTHIHNQ